MSVYPNSVCSLQVSFHINPILRITIPIKEYPEYMAWRNMKDRCSNPRNREYHNYGGRGIVVCERWSDFHKFLLDMGFRPSSKYSLERIDNNKGYSPDNCKWATDKEQRYNSRSITYYKHDNEVKTLSEWAKCLGTRPSTLWHKIKNKRWDCQRVYP